MHSQEAHAQGYEVIAGLVAGVAFAIAPGHLSLALTEWARQAHVQLLYSNRELKALGSLGFHCTSCDPFAALDALIDGRDIQWTAVLARGVVTVTVKVVDPDLQP